MSKSKSFRGQRKKKLLCNCYRCTGTTKEKLIKAKEKDMLDLNKLEKQLDDALSRETKESLSEWMNRNCEEIEISVFKETSKNRKRVTLHSIADKMYMVKYGKGAYEDYTEVTIFVTNSKEKADAYEVRFNTLLDKLIEHYRKMYKFKSDDIYESDYYVTKLCDVMDINSCFVEEVEFRP